MSYRPHTAVGSTPQGLYDDQFSYTFDSSNTSGLVNTIPALTGTTPGTTLNIPLQLQTDAVFLLRAIKISAVEGEDSPSSLNIRFRNTFGRILSDDFIPVNLSYQPAGVAVAGFLFIPFEPELLCAPGGIFLVDFQNMTNAPVAPPKITMYGPKRYRQ